nr:hypothetical protein [Tanacetum cinerariifolium]
MATTIEQQVAMDEALVPSTQRCPFFKAFLVTTDVPEIYMQEFWATAYVHQQSIRFKINNKKLIVSLESFREMLHICPRIHGQSFDELPFEEEILDFIRRSRRQTHISQPGGSGTDEGTGSKPGVLDVPTDESEEELSWNSSDDEEDNDNEDKDSDERDDDDEDQEVAKFDDKDDTDKIDDDEEEGKSDEEDDNEETREEESFDPILKTPEGIEDEGDGEEDQGLNVNEEEYVEEDEEDELYRDVNINQGRDLQVNQEVEDSHVTLTPINSDGQQESWSVSSQFVTNMLNPTSDVGMESIFAASLTFVAPLPITAPTMTPSTVTTITTTSQAPIPSTPIPSEVLQNRFDDRLKSLEASFSEYIQTNPFAEAVSNIPSIVHQYMNQQMIEAVRVSVQIQTNRLRDSYQRENDEFLRTIDENIKMIIKEQVKGQVKEQVSKILPRIEQSVNAQLEAEVLTRSSHSSRTSYAVAADLSEMELKKILIEKMEGNKMKDPPLDQTGGLRDGEKASASESAFAEEPVQTTSQIEDAPKKPPTPDRDWNKTLPAIQRSTQTWISELAKQADSRSSFNELLDTPLDFSNFIMNWLRVDTLTPELLVGPTYELMKGSCQQYPHNLLQPLPLIPDNRGRRVIPFAHFINNDLEYLCGDASSRKYTTSEPIEYDKHALWGVSHWGRKRQQFYGFAINQESALNVYSKRRIIAVTDLKIMEWHSYKHLD